MAPKAITVPKTVRNAKAAHALRARTLREALYRRVADDGADFLILTPWDSEEAVERFAGDDPERAVFYPEEDRFLIRRGETVDHYSVEFLSGSVAEVDPG